MSDAEVERVVRSYLLQYEFNVWVSVGGSKCTDTGTPKNGSIDFLTTIGKSVMIGHYK